MSKKIFDLPLDLDFGNPRKKKGIFGFHCPNEINLYGSTRLICLIQKT
jgi:hypothetical protein